MKTEQHSQEFNTPKSALTARISKREQQVLRLLAQGATSKEIGNILGISHKTVDAHRDSIKKKLQADSIAQLVQCAIIMGLIVPQLPPAKPYSLQ